MPFAPKKPRSTLAQKRQYAFDPFRFETLETRLTLSAGASSFAHFADLMVTSRVAASVSVQVRPDDFEMPRGSVILGFIVHGTEKTGADPTGVAVVRRGTPVSVPLVRKSNMMGGPESLTIARVGRGDFALRWRAEHGTLGPSELDVFLAGDVNGDLRVDTNDLDLLRGRLGIGQHDSRYLFDADVNRDGVISRGDLRLARMNLGVSTSIRPPIVTASLSPDSDPDGNGVVLKPEITVVGQTTPGGTVRLGQPSAAAVIAIADANGRFQFTTELRPGLSTLRVEAINGFGQSVVVEREVRLGDVVLDWNASMLGIIRDWTTLSNDPYSNRVVPERPPMAARNLAMVHAAMFDAVNAIDHSYQPYHADVIAPEGASSVAAAAAAAERVASSLYREPDELAVFDAALAEALATVPDGPGKVLGIELGQQVADEILAWRSNDGASARVPYTPGTEPGDWNRTFPDFLPPLLPQWPNVTPFAMTSPTQFRPTAPPELNDVEYATAVNEVKELGRFDSTTRTADQTAIALFWADGGGTFTPPGHWNQIAEDVALARGNTLAENARLFALLNIAEADAGISAWDTKYAYNFWRPIDAIRRGETDGNDLTTPDATWTPLLKTPPFPTYTSGHSTFSGAADAVLSYIFGPNIHFASTSDGHTGFSQRPLSESQITTRSFDSFAQAADEAGRSRIYGGIHFEFDNSAGLAAGRALGQYILDRLLLPIASPVMICRSALASCHSEIESPGDVQFRL